jgi:carbonic anhydrase/acetyltransferase-like protein (isoleucine patch superfamily)
MSSDMMMPKGKVMYLSDSGRLIKTPADGRDMVYLDIGDQSYEALLSDLMSVYRTVNLDPRSVNNNGHDIVIEGIPNSIKLGLYASLGSRVVVRSDETHPENNQTFTINGNIGKGGVVHYTSNVIGKKVQVGPFVTFHGSHVGSEAIIRERAVLDKNAVIPEECDVGACSYIDSEVFTKVVEPGTIYTGDVMVRLPQKAIAMQVNAAETEYEKTSRSGAREHRLNFSNKGYFDPLALIELSEKEGFSDPTANHIYVGPFAHIVNCEFAGSNVNIQDHNHRDSTIFLGDNIGAHGVISKNTTMQKGSAALFSALMTNAVLGERAVAGPLATIVGAYMSKPIYIPDGKFVVGYVDSSNIQALTEQAKTGTGVVKDGEGNITALMTDVSKVAGLESRMEHIQAENARHSAKASNILGIPTYVFFSPKRLEEIAKQVR